MTHSEFDILFESTIEKLRQLGKTKGREYSNSETDRLANFKEIAKEIGVSPYQVLLTYSKKHSRAIDSFCKLGHSCSDESIESRIVDRILYDFLLLGLIADASTISNEKSLIEPVRWTCGCGLGFNDASKFNYHHEHCPEAL